jgi:hypothetical protein
MDVSHQEHKSDLATPLSTKAAVSKCNTRSENIKHAGQYSYQVGVIYMTKEKSYNNLNKIVWLETQRI